MQLEGLPPPPPPSPGPGPFFVMAPGALEVASRADAEGRPIGRLDFHGMLIASCASIDTLPAETTALRALGQIVDGTRKRVNLGFRRLPELRDLRILSAWGVDGPQLELIASCPNLEVLQLQYVRASTLAPLSRLSNLRHLVIDWAPQLKSVGGIEALPGLRTLRLQDARKIDTLEPVRFMSGLEGLALVAGIFKKWVVQSYSPLSSLSSLKWLELDTVLPMDKSLKPLAGFRELQHLMISSGYFHLEEVARLKAALPYLDAPALDAYWPCGGLRCDQCDTELLRMSGYRGRVLCPNCDAATIKRHVARFEELVSAGTVGW